MNGVKWHQVNAPKRSYTRNVDWNEYREFIVQKVNEGETHANIIKLLEKEKGVTIELNQLKRLLRSWGATNRNLTKKQKEYIQWICQQRSAAGKRKHAFLHLDTLEEIDQGKLEKILKAMPVRKNLDRGMDVSDVSAAGLWAYTPWSSTSGSRFSSHKKSEVKPRMNLEKDLKYEDLDLEVQWNITREDFEAMSKSVCISDQGNEPNHSQKRQSLLQNVALEENMARHGKSPIRDQEMIDFDVLCNEIMDEMQRHDVRDEQQKFNPLLLSSPQPLGQGSLIGTSPRIHDYRLLITHIENWKDFALSIVNATRGRVRRNISRNLSTNEALVQVWTSYITPATTNMLPYNVYVSMLEDREIILAEEGKISDRSLLGIMKHYRTYIPAISATLLDSDNDLFVFLPELLNAYGINHIFSAFLLDSYGQYLFDRVGTEGSVIPLGMALDIYNRLGMEDFYRTYSCRYHLSLIPHRTPQL